MAARICQGYVWPNLDLADPKNRRSPFYVQTLVNDCAQVFRQNDEPDNVIRNYRILLTRTETPQTADWARVQLAMAYEQSGQLKDALHYLRQVQSTNDYQWALRRIPQIQQQLR